MDTRSTLVRRIAARSLGRTRRVDFSWRPGLAPVALAAGLFLGCNKQVDLGTLPRIVIPIEADPPKAEPKPEPKASPEAEAIHLEEEHDLPDPPAARRSEQVRITLVFDRGNVRLVKAEAVTLKEAELTPRRVGRFAAELWRGGELVERLRFDFPLLGAEEDEKDAFESGLTAEATILLPALPRPTTLRILDRRTRQEVLLSWPLEGVAASVHPSETDDEPDDEEVPDSPPRAPSVGSTDGKSTP